jgi:hypothetical protein
MAGGTKVLKVSKVSLRLRSGPSAKMTERQYYGSINWAQFN